MKLRIVVELTDLEAKALDWVLNLGVDQFPGLWPALKRARAKLDIARRRAEYEFEDWATK